MKHVWVLCCIGIAYFFINTPAYAEKKITINIQQQMLYAYEDGKEVNKSPVVTGRNGYRGTVGVYKGTWYPTKTPKGTFSIYKKVGPRTLKSPLPRSHPLWYRPSYVAYSLYFKEGYMIHDASAWRSVFGLKANYKVNGSHGCVNVPRAFSKWLYEWAPVGTIVEII